MIRHFLNALLLLLPPSRMFGLRRALLRACGVQVAEGVSFCGHGWIYGRGALAIGADTWLSPRVVFYTHEDVPITVGAHCDIGPGVEFIVGSHVIGEPSRRAGEGTAQAIAIGDGCWIGAGCKILDGVHIGAGCVVAAGAVVTQSMPPNSLVAGVPAVVKKGYS